MKRTRATKIHEPGTRPPLSKYREKVAQREPETLLGIRLREAMKGRAHEP